MLTPIEFDRRQWAYWEQKKQEQRRDITNAWNTANLMRKQGRMPSLNVLLNPARNVYGDEKTRFDQQYQAAVSWATEKPVKPIPKELP
jgi:hypothetical protein